MTVVKIKPFEVTDSLAELGLTSEIIEYSIRRGELARDSCTKNDPPSAPGFDAWSKSVRALRDSLIPKGWERDDTQNFSTVVSPNKEIAIAVATGDAGTGDVNSEPHTKYPKGEAAKSAVETNQLYLFPQDKPKAEKKRATWFLLKRRVGDTVFSELSLPAVITEEGHIVKWAARIILNPILIDANFEVEDDSSLDEIDVPVFRRKTN